MDLVCTDIGLHRLGSAPACAQVIVPIPNPTESSAENRLGLVLGGSVGIGGQAAPAAAGCLPGARHCVLGRFSQVCLRPLVCVLRCISQFCHDIEQPRI